MRTRLCGKGRCALLVENHGEQGLIDFDFVLIFDEAQFPEFVHEEIHARTGGTDHLGQGFLGNFRQDAVRLILFAIAREKQERARQALFAGIEELVDQILFDPNVVREHIRDEMGRQRMLGVEHAEHFVFLDDEDRGGRNGGSRAHADRLARHASLAKKVARTEHGDDGFLSGAIDHGELHAALLDVHDAIGGRSLRIDRFASAKFGNFSRHSGGIEEDLRVERLQLVGFFSFAIQAKISLRALSLMHGLACENALSRAVQKRTVFLGALRGARKNEGCSRASRAKWLVDYAVEEQFLRSGREKVTKYARIKGWICRGVAQPGSAPALGAYQPTPTAPTANSLLRCFH